MAKAIKVTSINISFGAKIPTQQYGNIELQIAYSADVEPGEDPDEVSKQLFEQVREVVSDALMPIARAKFKATKSYMLSLPPKERTEFMAQFASVDALAMLQPELALVPELVEKLLDEAAPKTTENAQEKTDAD